MIAALGIGVLGLVLRGSRRTWAVIAVAVLLGTTVSTTVASVRKFATPPLTEYASIAPGGIEAARFIRRNSGSEDRIATNVHCQRARASHCLTGSYWIAGYAERRVLVEGWAYQSRVDDTYPDGVQSAFWDQEKLRLNDEAFTNPTRDVVETLRTKYGVQWLLLDERVSAPPKNLDRLTELRFQFGTVRVYQLYPPPPANPFPSQTPSPTGTPSQTPSFPTGSPSLPTQTPGLPDSDARDLEPDSRTDLPEPALPDRKLADRQPPANLPHRPPPNPAHHHPRPPKPLRRVLAPPGVLIVATAATSDRY